MENLKIGDKFKGIINNKIFIITKIDKINDLIQYECNNNLYTYGLKAFKNCLLEKIN